MAVVAKRRDTPRAGPQAPPPPQRGIGIRRTRLRLTLTLALTLLVIGIASIEGAVLLQRALRMPTADDIAQRVCTAYQTQNYDLLANQIDPAKIAPTVTTPWDSSARTAFIDQLHTEDDALGKVTRCTYSSLAFTIGNGLQPVTKRQYLFTMQRDKLYSTGMNFVHESDAGWLISRDSDFLGVPVGS